MPRVDRVIIRAWRALPEAVLNYDSFTSPDTRVPTSRVQKTILPKLLDVTADGYRFAAAHWRSEKEVSDKTAEAITKRLADAAGLLVAAVAWHECLWNSYRDWSRQRGSAPTNSPTEWLMVPSLDLSRKHGMPPADSHAATDVAWDAMTAKAGSPSAPTWPDVQRFVRRNRAKLHASLEAAWASGYTVALPDDDLYGLVDSYCISAYDGQRDEWAVDSAARSQAVTAWLELVAASDSATLVPGLSSTAPPQRPDLEGQGSRESAALDRSISDRLERMFKKADEVITQPLDDDGDSDAPSFSDTTAERMVTATISSSVSGFGLSEASARAIILVMHRIASSMSWDADNAIRRATVAQAPTRAAAHFVRQWHRVGYNYRYVAGPETNLGRILASPIPLLLARAWTRAARTQFLQVTWRPDARMGWEHITGAINSQKRNISSFYYAEKCGRGRVLVDDTALPESAAIEGDFAERDFKPAADPESEYRTRLESMIEHVVAVGRQVDGDDADADFWFTVSDGEQSAESTWERWVSKAAQKDNRSADEYPSYDSVCVHARRRTNTADQRSASYSFKDVQDILTYAVEHELDPKSVVTAVVLRATSDESHNESEDRTLWEKWSRAYATTRLELSSESIDPPSFPEMVTLIQNQFKYR